MMMMMMMMIIIGEVSVGGGLEGLILRKKIIKIVANRCHVLKV